jgi:methionyl-tRNA formyltransferase
LLEGTLAPLPQDDAQATPAPKVFRETSGIDWTRPREIVRNFVHGLSPTPCAWTMWNGQVLKVYRTSRVPGEGAPGSWSIRDHRFIVACADGMLSLDEVQLPGKRRMTAEEIVRGYRGPSEGVFA